MSALDAIERNQEGFLVNPADWNKEIALEIAHNEGIPELSEAHWKIIEFSRANAEKSGAAPTLRQITKGAGDHRKECKTMLRQVANQLIDKGAECIIAGCTEIPLELAPQDITVPLFDPLTVLAKAAIREAKP